MKPLDIKEIINNRKPGFFKKYPAFISRTIIRFLNWLLHIPEINQVIDSHRDKKGVEFIDEVLEYLDFSYMLSSIDRKKIPSEGKVIVVSNHPLGGLDGLAIIKALSEIRPDIKVVASDVLTGISPLRNLFLPFNLFKARPQRSRLANIIQSITNEEAVIFFPSAEVSRFKAGRIVDGFWHNGPIYFAQKHEVPILPLYVKSRNTIWFYLMSLLHKDFSMFLLPREVFKKRHGSLTIKIGDPIPGRLIKNSPLNSNQLTKMLKKHVYRLARKKRPEVFKTEKTILHPIDKTLLKKELSASVLLDSPAESVKLYKVYYESARHVIKEIARLRELTFRRVEEGTGDKLDLDEFDRFYTHLVLWNEEKLEIMGAYRLVRVEKVLQQSRRNKIYTATLFNYPTDFNPILKESAELGRSFIQYKYWNTKALDYLWRGIGAYLTSHQEIRYLIGAVSISHSFSETAKNLIVQYYRNWYGNPGFSVTAKSQFFISREQQQEINDTFEKKDASADFQILKQTLRQFGYAVPVLFRQYINLCRPGGVTFLDFCVDLDFNTVDGLMLLDINKMDPRKQERYHIIRKKQAPQAAISD